MSRAPKYRPEFARMAAKACEMGAIDKDLADLFDVNRDTIHGWRKRYPTFAKACADAKATANGKVEHALFRRATGFSHPDVDIRVIEGKVVQTEIEKHFPPSDVACIFWLKNRDPQRWKDKIETGVTDRDGNDVKPVEPYDLARRIAFLLTQGAAAAAAKGSA